MGQDDLAPVLFNLVQAHPATRLKAALEIQRQIDLLVEELIAQWLRRDDAPTWERIGKLLRPGDPMPASTAHRRYGHLAPASKRRRRKNVN